MILNAWHRHATPCKATHRTLPRTAKHGIAKRRFVSPGYAPNFATPSNVSLRSAPQSYATHGFASFKAARRGASLRGASQREAWLRTDLFKGER